MSAHVLPAPRAQSAPRLLSVLGAFGVAPFWLPALAGLAWPSSQPIAIAALSAYAAVILSFLAGARMGMTLMAVRPSSATLCLSMAPPIVAWVLAFAPIAPPALRLILLALALLAHAVWDARARSAPQGYGRLRWRLTLGALSGLLAGAAVLHG
ncbi:MAG: DUF3429 domain-containing protein [Alphaproteobacteria bacterium]|nr:DUF3429 domain-containing protein [Alphaproteobacteria bacterium]